MSGLVSIGDMAQTFQLRRQVTEAKARIASQSQAVTTGRVADPVAHLRGDLAPLAAVERDLSGLASLSRAAKETGTFVSVAQLALGDMQEIGESQASGLLAGATAGQASQIPALAEGARQAFLTVVQRLNTEAAGRSLFAGIATDGPATRSGEDILATLDALTAGMTTAGQVTLAIDDWFDAGPAGYSGLAYVGANDTLSLPVDEAAPVDFGLTADDPRLRDLLKGLALAALSDGTALQGDTAGGAALVRTAAERLLTANDGMVELRAGLGALESRIADSATRMETQASALDLVRTAMLAADPYDSATALQAAESQLQTLYALTARLQRLSLTEYL